MATLMTEQSIICKSVLARLDEIPVVNVRGKVKQQNEGRSSYNIR